jgi:2'-5' RNA ligase
VRLFAAVYPPADAVASVHQALAPLGDPDGLRWLPAEQWHITVAFYAEVADRAVDDLGERLRRAAAHTPPVTLALARAGTFPRRAAAGRQLWVGVRGEVDVLRRLAERCAAAGRRVGLAMEDRPYRPHVTVARGRGRAGVDMRPALAGLGAYDGPAWRASELVLVRSFLGPPLRHERLAAYPLSGDGRAGDDGPA